MPACIHCHYDYRHLTIGHDSVADNHLDKMTNIRLLSCRHSHLHFIPIGLIAIVAAEQTVEDDHMPLSLLSSYPAAQLNRATLLRNTTRSAYSTFSAFMASLNLWVVSSTPNISITSDATTHCYCHYHSHYNLM